MMCTLVNDFDFYVQAFAIPGMYAMWASWAPSGERATLVSMSFSGQNIANALAFPTAALLCKGGFAGGWPSVFYVYGKRDLPLPPPNRKPHINPTRGRFFILTELAADPQRRRIRDRDRVGWVRIG
jgi:hypothetical protein